MKLWERVGHEKAARLWTMRNRERRQGELGLRDVDEPSQFDFEVNGALGRSEFTPEERQRIRYLLEMNPGEGVDSLEVGHVR